MQGRERHSLSNPANAWMNDPVSVAIVRQMQEDLRWAMEHYDELDQRYHGESIVVWKKQVIAHGNGEDEVLRLAATADRPREQLVVVAFPTFFESPH